MDSFGCYWLLLKSAEDFILEVSLKTNDVTSFINFWFLKNLNDELFTMEARVCFTSPECTSLTIFQPKCSTTAWKIRPIKLLWHIYSGHLSMLLLSWNGLCIYLSVLFYDVLDRTSLRISLSRFWMQSSFLLRQRWAAIRFLLRRRMSWMNSSCSEVSLCILMRIWKSLRGRLVIWSTGKGSFTWEDHRVLIHFIIPMLVVLSV